MDMARERISLILELMAMFFSFQMTFSLVIAAVVWAILDSTSGGVTFHVSNSLICLFPSVAQFIETSRTKSANLWYRSQRDVHVFCKFRMTST